MTIFHQILLLHSINSTVVMLRFSPAVQKQARQVNLKTLFSPAPWPCTGKACFLWIVEIMDGWRFHSDIILLLFCRAQDQASMQLSEMEEEMDQRIHAGERKTKEQVGQTHQILSISNPCMDMTLWFFSIFICLCEQWAGCVSSALPSCQTNRHDWISDYSSKLWRACWSAGFNNSVHPIYQTVDS